MMNTDNLVLRPNCLLTKYPLVFINGPRSLFYHEKLGGDLQDFIAAHGYMVNSPALPFRSKKLRRRHLSEWLKKQKTESFHFILSQASYIEFKEIFSAYQTSTYTLIANRFVKPYRSGNDNRKEPLYYRLHRLYCFACGTKADSFDETLQDKSTEFYERFLDHCIELAENEFI